jgi:hypothetical protein
MVRSSVISHNQSLWSSQVVEEPLPPPPGGFAPLGSTPKGLKEAAVALLSSAAGKAPPSRSTSRSDSMQTQAHGPYREYVEKLLKTSGLRKTLDQLRKIFHDSLDKVFEALPHDINFSVLEAAYGDSRENSVS